MSSAMQEWRELPEPQKYAIRDVLAAIRELSAEEATEVVAIALKLHEKYPPQRLANTSTAEPT